MKIPRCAPTWLTQIASQLVQTGADNPGRRNFTWIKTWNVALHWVQAPAYSVLFYQCDGVMDNTMQMQLMDAFSRSCKKSLISIVEETECSAFCFFGGVPDDVQLATIQFPEIQGERKYIPYR